MEKVEPFVRPIGVLVDYKRTSSLWHFTELRLDEKNDNMVPSDVGQLTGNRVMVIDQKLDELDKPLSGGR